MRAATRTIAPEAPRPETATRTLDLDALAAMSIEELTALYRRGTVPQDLSALDGAPTSRMLTLVGPPGRGPLAAALRAFARARVFPWAGKSFTATSASTGRGLNRVRLAGTREWFPFETRVEGSVVDGAPCIVLDYEQPENPFFIRAIHDELREVDPGLFLGPAMLKTRSAPALVLYFACDCGPG